MVKEITNHKKPSFVPHSPGLTVTQFAPFIPWLGGSSSLEPFHYQGSCLYFDKNLKTCCTTPEPCEDSAERLGISPSQSAIPLPRLRGYCWDSTPGCASHPAHYQYLYRQQCLRCSFTIGRPAVRLFRGKHHARRFQFVPGAGLH